MVRCATLQKGKSTLANMSKEGVAGLMMLLGYSIATAAAIALWGWGGVLASAIGIFFWGCLIVAAD